MYLNIINAIPCDIFSGLWNYIKTTFWIIVVVIVIFIIIVIISVINDSKKQEEAKKKKQEEAKKAKEIDERRKNYHIKHLPNVYDRERSNTLLQARKLLNIIYVNNPLTHDICDRSYSVQQESAWGDASEQLKRLLQNPRWQELNLRLGEYTTDCPVFPELDIEYIDRLLYKRSHNT